MFLQPRLVVERVELRRPAVHVQINDALRLRREMRETGHRRMDERARGGCRPEPRREPVERHTAHGQSRPREELAAGEVIQVIVAGIHRQGFAGRGGAQSREIVSSRFSRRFATMVHAANSGAGSVSAAFDSPLVRTFLAASGSAA